jgi:uncharacterized SAM-dependent methyltransferase
MPGTPADHCSALPVAKGVEKLSPATIYSCTGQCPASKAAPLDLADGLRATPKQVPCRFLYDSAGSQIYEQITQLEEYYPFQVRHWSCQ